MVLCVDKRCEVFFSICEYFKFWFCRVLPELNHSVMLFCWHNYFTNMTTSQEICQIPHEPILAYWLQFD